MTTRDILALQESEIMGRRFYTKPEVHRTKAEHPRWYCRPSKPVLVAGVMRPKQMNPVYLGFCSSMSRRQAEKARDEVCATLNRTPAMVQSQVVFGDLLTSYRQTYFPTLAASTQRGYDSRIRCHIEPAFGQRRLCEIGAQEVQGWLNGIDGTHKTKSLILAVLASVFEAAADWGYTTERNPTKRVKVRGAPGRDLTVPEPHMLARLLTAIEEPYILPVEVGLFCGLRAGEIRGLISRSVDPPRLHVIWSRDRETNELREPKRNSRRDAPLPEWLAARLLALAPTGDDDLVFPGLAYSALWEHFNSRAKAVGLWRPGFGLHTLRRCYVTYRREQGGEQLQQALGHRTAAMTEAYNRPGIERQLVEVQRMWEMIYFEPAEGGVQ